MYPNVSLFSFFISVHTIHKNEISKQFVGKHTFNAVSLGNNVVLITFLGIFVLNQGNEMNLYIFSFNQTLV